jgi:DNA-binding Lrp family transcriptional regulator
MDERLLLEILQKDARISEANLAKMLNSSEEQVKKKIDELKKRGIIRAFRTYIDWEKFGDNVITAYIDVKVTPQARTGFSSLGAELAANEKVEEVVVASGEYDLRIKIKGKDLKDVSNFVTEVLAPKGIVTGTYSHFVLKKFKDNGVILGEADKDKKLVVSA